MNYVITSLLILIILGGCSDSNVADKNNPRKADSPNANGEETFTNVQDSKVDEPDFIKVGLEHLYVAKDSDLEVVDREDISYIGSLKLEYNYQNLQVFTLGNQIITIGSINGTSIQVDAFKAAKGALPELQKSFDFMGQLVDARLVAGTLVLVLRDKIPFNNSRDEDEFIVFDDNDETSIRGIPCDAIVASPIDNTHENRLAKVVLVDILDLDKEPATAGMVGGSEQIYQTEKNLYVISDQSSFTLLTKLVIDSEKFTVEPVAIGAVSGHVKDQWALNEINYNDEDLLGIFTTDGKLGQSNRVSNNLRILSEDDGMLETVAEITDFGKGEDIRSVRYVGDIAYAVTFKKTDPLFAFDLSNPLKLSLLDELKIPGFSTYMHPVGEGQMIGVGFDATEHGSFALFQGIQISLFDVSNPKRLERVDNIVIGERGSSSEVTANHHAFYYDSEMRVVGIPLIELESQQSSDPRDWNYGSRLAFSGAVLFQIEGNELREWTRVTHEEFIPKGCRGSLEQSNWWQDEVRSEDINRLFKVDGRLLSLSRYGIKAHDLEDPDKELASVEFPFKKCSYYGRE
jgi:inhibitor of cysteine peptidase